MPYTIPFDTYDSMKNLENSGLTEAQAKAITTIIANLVDVEIVNRDYLHDQLKTMENRLFFRLGCLITIINLFVFIGLKLL